MRKKLIEVALPLEAINVASAREKSIRHGHPSTLHLWWARRPLAACRAVLFASLVDDPESDPDAAKLQGEAREHWVGEERRRLHGLIEELVRWENSNDATVLRAARAEIARCVASQKVEAGELRAEEPLGDGETVGALIRKGRAKVEPAEARGQARAWVIRVDGLPDPEAVNAFLARYAPPVYDPFCGGGSIPLEAQRLGLRAFASDLNPVPVLITKALIEIPPKFAGQPPVNPEDNPGARASRPHSDSDSNSRAGETPALREDSHSGWHSRGYLPHFDRPDLLQSITFRLHDSLPASVLEHWANCTDTERRRRAEAYLDSGQGSCDLVDPRIARLVQDALLHFDDERYRLLAWAIMPNHVHVLIETREGHPLAEVVHSWKSFTAKKANALLGRSGPFWAADYFDRYVRDADHLERVVAYIRENPVKAGLAATPADWPWGSASPDLIPGARPSRPQTTLDETLVRARPSRPRKTAGGTPALRGMERDWPGASGLAADVRYYGRWMRDEAEKRIGHLYPKVKVTPEMVEGRPDLTPYVGRELTVIAWLWARTVASPNPSANGAHVPLVRSFWLSTRPGNKAWIEPVVDQATMSYRFEVRMGQGQPREGTIGRGRDVCLLTGAPIPRDYIRAEGVGGRLGAKLMAVVAEGTRGRIYLPPIAEHEAIASNVVPDWKPTTEIPNTRYTTPVIYGMTTHADLFTPRQLAALTTFSDLVSEAREKILASSSGARASRPLPSPTKNPSDGTPPLPDEAYENAVATYLALGVSKLADSCNALVSWKPSMSQTIHLFTRQAIPMLWDHAEPNIFSGAAGDYGVTLGNLAKALEGTPASVPGVVRQCDAGSLRQSKPAPIYSTDPPYYDNVPYADLSDFFYIWLRRSLSEIYPDLFGTMLVPKAQELVADPFRHGGRENSRRFFEEGMGRVFANIRELAHPDIPTTVFYAFKQSEDDDTGSAGVPPAEDGGRDGRAPGDLRASTGWETMLQGLIDSGMKVTGTWPMRTELGNRIRSLDSNALASSIVLVCHPRPDSAPTASRREYLTNLKRELPDALRALQHGNIAPVDLAQASIGPGMAVFSRYAKVVESDGARMGVRTALQLINQALDEVLSEQEGEFDADTRWAIAWFDQFGAEEGPFGTAETLATAKNTSVSGLVQAGFLWSRGGKVRLLRRDELPADYDPSADRRRTVWEVTQHLIRALDHQGEDAAAALLRQVGSHGEVARDLAYRLYTTCERKKWAQDALAYNSLVIAWPQITRLAARTSDTPPRQGEMF